MHTKNIFIPDTKVKPFLGISPILNSPTNVPVGQGFLGSNLPNPSTQNSTPLITFHKKGFQEMKVRKVKGLCFKCDEKYSPTHNCLNKRLLLFQWDDYDTKIYNNEFFIDTQQPNEVQDFGKDPGANLSLNAMSSIIVSGTMHS